MMSRPRPDFGHFGPSFPVETRARRPKRGDLELDLHFFTHQPVADRAALLRQADAGRSDYLA
jgi:hypothetical protein